MWRPFESWPAWRGYPFPSWSCPRRKWSKLGLQRLVGVHRRPYVSMPSPHFEAPRGTKHGATFGDVDSRISNKNLSNWDSISRSPRPRQHLKRLGCLKMRRTHRSSGRSSKGISYSHGTMRTAKPLPCMVVGPETRQKIVQRPSRSQVMEQRGPLFISTGHARQTTETLSSLKGLSTQQSSR